mmetsp:Transcript_6529/g.9491  ORF Transcript_6529/g.9491 Transcript_6529/m.9491 type:complete len:287 (+) Transcript_6529:184-1044(+)|eukprot:CAMPEP_0195509022 /NCGR_PEP_ID=MMETSP0794_2-20130614/2073_1 /TAXON_ID=515487 /ORGANISM="Stephanopyxis turris, Strain CCMP 815" /LENGTH=286 /DNA_ID=CAMNT_0040636133 /DNA_START=184 /DNA_END=1044 /DNA_ORIENTATION=-
MSLSHNRSVRSFQSSAALPSLNDKRNTLTPVGNKPNVHKSKASPSKLPSLQGGSLPSINAKAKPLDNLPQAQNKKQLAPVERTAKKGRKRVHNTEAQDNQAETKKERKRGKKKEEKQAIKEQVNIALKAVREVFSTPKGQNILQLETKVYHAEQNEEFINCKVKRKDEAGSLGISFTIPARVMALGWESGQHLVVTGITPKPGVKSNLAVNDIVVAVDGVPVNTIEDLKKCVAGKKKMHLKCIRTEAPIAQEDLDATQARVEKALKSAVKHKVKESFRSKGAAQSL